MSLCSKGIIQMNVRAFMPVLLATAVFGCGPAEGPDALTNKQVTSPPSNCNAVCHSATSIISPDPVITNGSGSAGKHVAHVSDIGFDCEKCHLGYDSQITHMNQQPETGPAVTLVYFDSTNPPPALWTKIQGPPRTGTCSNLACHGTDTLDWYGTDTSSYQDCVTCHAYAISSRRQVVGAQGDFGGNSSIASHHVNGSDPTNAQCLVCHNQSTHTQGTVRLRHADTGASIVYDPADLTSLEPFCLSCHDSNGAALTSIGPSAFRPFAGSTLGQIPYLGGTRVASDWGKSYGHNQKGLTCMGNGSPTTGCHANGHGSSHVGILARNMTLPVPADRYIENDYDLCLNCHSSYTGVRKEDIFGVRFGGAYYRGYGPGFNFPPYDIPSIHTKFRDQNNRGTGYPYDNSSIYIDFWLWGANSVNLHWVHIALDVWNYRGAVPSGVSCTACHNVHGTNNPYGMTHDEMGYQHYVEVNGDQYSQLNSISPYLLDLHPMNCTFGCHKPVEPGFGQASAWLESANE
ncbi:MAG TPA: hypothetical protein DCS42_05000 [Nitrospiraceae bacterium]|nr:hypothetical protein [Nitrospiraceae bacterium]